MLTPPLKSCMEAAFELLVELEGAHLEVVLIPASEQRHIGHCVRAVQEQNCDWYRQLCDEHQSSRRRRSFKSDTRIKRQHTIRALERMSRGDLRGTYAERLKKYVEVKAREMRRWRKQREVSDASRTATTHRAANRHDCAGAAL